MRTIYKSLIGTAIFILTAPAVIARPIVVAGNLLTSETQGAVYEITSDGNKTILTNPQYATSYAASGGGCYNNGTYYMSKIWMSGYSAQTYTFDTAEIPWKTVNTDGDGSSSVLSTDYSYDTQADVLYGFIKYMGSKYKIGKITPSASWSTRYVQVQEGTDMKDVVIDCTNPDNKWHGIAFDADNQLWVITYGGALNTVDKNTGEMTLVGETGIKPTVNGSAAFDFKTGKLYWAVKNAGGSAVYEVNTTTAEASKVMDVPDNLQLMGLFIPEPAAEDAAPAAPANVRYSFVDGSLEGAVIFDIPSTTFDDLPAEGEVSYYVTFDDNEPISGTSAFGQKNVSVPVSVTSSGNVSSSIYLQNAAGKSPVAKYEGYVGYGVPASPTNITISYVDGKMIVRWDAVSEVSDNLGYIGEIKYNVTRKTGETTESVATGISDTEFEETIQEPESGMCTYSYTVTAVNGDCESAGVSSPTWTLGSITLPYSNDFSTENDFNSLTIINCQPESQTWTWSKSGSYASISFDRTYTKDDWLISPPFKIEEGYLYHITVEAKSQSTRYPERVGISWGYEPTSDGMSETLLNGDEDVPGTFTSYSTMFVAPSDGVAYAGIHACSDKDMSTLMIDNLSIVKGVPSHVNEILMEDIAIDVQGHDINIECKGNVVITSIDGTSVTDIESVGSVTASVVPGIYVVTANGQSVKVIVR